MRWSLAAIVGILAAGESRADIGPFLPATDYAHATHRIETREAYPDHVFVVQHFALTFGAPPKTEFTILAPGQPIVISVERRGDATLFIVPKTAAERYPTAEAVANAVYANEISGAVTKGRFHSRETVPTWSGNEVTITHRLRRSNGGDGWELVRVSWGPMWQWYLAVGFVTVGIVASGVWWMRRKRAARTKAA